MDGVSFPNDNYLMPISIPEQRPHVPQEPIAKLPTLTVKKVLLIASYILFTAFLISSPFIAVPLSTSLGISFAATHTSLIILGETGVCCSYFPTLYKDGKAVFDYLNTQVKNPTLSRVASLTFMAAFVILSELPHAYAFAPTTLYGICWIVGI